MTGPAWVAEALDDVGRPGSRHRVPTPALVCDLDRLEANVATMARWADGAGLALRPHAKSHKSALVAGLQLRAGATGIACAKASEAEALVAALAVDEPGRRISVLLTSPPVGPPVARRLWGLARACELLVAVDHPAGVDELVAAAPPDPPPLAVVVDADVGTGRTGVAGPREARDVARRVTAGPLRIAGVQGYAGHVQHLADPDERRAAVIDGARRLREVVVAVADEGGGVDLVTGGGTGSHRLDAEVGVLTELQVGSYVFMDREYRDALGDDPAGGFAQSLTVATTVVSANRDGFVTVDAGLKSMATDAGRPVVVDGRPGEAFHFFGDEHGLVTAGGPPRRRRGERLELVPPHCDPTVDRHDRLWLVRGDVLVGVAPVTARGCSQ